MATWFEDGGQPSPKGWWDGIGEAARGVGGFLQDTLTAPMFLGGAALASGEGFGGMQRGMQAGAQFADQRRQQQQRRAFDQLLADPKFSEGVDPNVARYAQAARDPSIIAKLNMPDERRAAEMHPYDMRHKQAMTAKAMREAAEAANGFAKQISPYQTSDGKIWGVQAGGNGDRLMHDLSNPLSPPIYVPRGRNLPPGMSLQGEMPAPGGMQPTRPTRTEPDAQPGPTPLAQTPAGAPTPTRIPHPAPIASAGPSAGMPSSQPMGGLFDERRYGNAPRAEQDGDNFAIMSPSRPSAGTVAPQARAAEGPTSAPQATVQPPAPRPAPGALTPFRGVKQVGRDLIEMGGGRKVGEVEDALRGGKFVEEDAKAAVADIKARNDAIESSRGKLPRLELINELIASPDVYQGTGANQILELKKAAKALGYDVGDVSGSEAVRMLANQFSLAVRNPAGGEGMPGSLSDRDLSFLVSSVPGLSNTREGNQLMARIMVESEKYKIRANTEAARYLQQKRSTGGLSEHMSAWMDKNPALSKEVRDRITSLTGVQYGVKNGASPGPGVSKQSSDRLNPPPVASESRGSFASPGIGGAIPTIRGDADYQSLPSGSQYYAPDGSLRRKN